MKRMDRIRRVAVIMLLGACVLAGTGCDEDVAGRLATLSGSYLGDVVAVMVTHCLEDALGVEAAGEADGNGHEHDTGALHDHEH